MSDRPLPALRFGDFVLDAAAYELRKRGRPVRLERLAMELLMLLVDRRGELVTRSEIVDRLWGRDVFLEVDASVNTLIRKIRRALGDAVDDPRFIQTVQGKGYRFSTAVEVVSAPPVPDDPGPPPFEQPAAPLPTPEPAAAPLAGRRLPSAAYVAVGLVAVVLVVVVGLLSWGRLRAGSGASAVTLAVMPFENLSGDPTREYLADGFAEETAASLGQIGSEHVSVLGRMATRAYKGTGKSPAEIGQELGVEYLVGGSVQVENQRLRVTSNLIRVRDQVQVWSKSYDQEPISMLEMQTELGTAVAEQIRQRLSPERLNSLAQRHTNNPDAADLYLRGRSLWNQFTPATTRLAMGFYKKATAVDPNYALAWSGMADALSAGPIIADVEPASISERARQAAERAVSVGDTLAETHTSEAVRQFFLGWDWRRSEAGFRRAIEINQNYAMAHRNLGVLLSHSGRSDQARFELGRAVQIDPADAMNYALSAMVEFHAGDSEAAVKHARSALAIDAGLYPALYHLGQAYEQMGRDDLALQALASAARSSNSNSKALSVKGYILAKVGRRSDADDVLGLFEQLSKTRYVPSYARALVHAGLGNRDATFEWLEKALVERDVHLIFLPVDPKWNRFRKDPRFQDILRRCAFTS